MILYDSIVYEMYNLIILAMSQLLLEGILNLYIAKKIIFQSFTYL